jgi:hypothetical protein
MQDKLNTMKTSVIKLTAKGDYNSGGCICHNGITNIEIDGTAIQLVYWNNKRKNREAVWDGTDINIILNELNGTSGKLYIKD